MTGQVDLYMSMLFVDQGMGNMIILTPPNTPTTINYIALVDFGSAAPSRCDDTVEWARDFLTYGQTQNAFLNLVVISHKDNDHWSLFPPLIDKLSGIGKSLNIEKLAYGGYSKTYSFVTKDKKTILDVLEGRLTKKTSQKNWIYYDSESSHYADQAVGALDEAYGVTFVPFAVNVEASRGAKDIVANTASLVVGIRYLNEAMVLPGDATADTIAYVNSLLDSGNAYEMEHPRLLSVPHHGSLRTIASNYLARDPDLDVAEEFAKGLDPWSVGASAGFANYHHPDEAVMSLFGAYTQERPKKHPYVSYHRNNKAWQVTNTKNGLFTTYLSVGTWDLAEKRRMVFVLTADGTSRVVAVAVDNQHVTGLAQAKAAAAERSAGRGRRHFVAMPADAPPSAPGS